jgi:hypothetical protein
MTTIQPKKEGNIKNFIDCIIIEKIDTDRIHLKRDYLRRSLKLFENLIRNKIMRYVT